MAVREERVLAYPREGPVWFAVPSARGLASALALAAVAGLLYAIRLDAPAFFDNEARYAAVAREMVLRGDYVTPYLDGTVFLNKPPLVSWLTALVFRLGGPTEWARIVSVVAAVAALVATCRLGALLYGEAAGLVAGTALATCLGFVLEARTLRPDMLVTAAVVIALYCWRRAAAGAGRGAWLSAMYAALGTGVLAKGLVPLLVAGLPIVAVTLREHGWRGLRRLHPGRGFLLFAAIVLPWHLLVAARHPGFAWDYVVNQHLLFFLDRKLPRDSEGDSLAFFWMAFAARTIPWSMLLPLTLGEAWRGAARGAAPAARASFFLWAWGGGLLLFFSCAPSRLEHYSIPALPAAALLAARAWQRGRAGELRTAAWVFLAAGGGAIALVGVVGVAQGRAFLAQTYWIAQAPGLLALAVPAATVIAFTGALAVAAAGRRRMGLLGAALAAAMFPVVAIVLRAEVAAEPLFSWRPLARALAAAVPPETAIVFEAPEEYQLVGGLAYYTGRQITLLEPPGFVPPTYLAGRTSGMFLPRGALEERWRAGERLAFVSDPLRRREAPVGLVPPPFHVLGRFGDRWVLTSFPLAAAR